MRPKKRSDGVSEDEPLPFSLGELVLCRYSSYPYWPATVDQTHQKSAKGKYVRWGTKSDGTRVLTFWCTFSNEDTGGWVRADRMVPFHPKLVDRIRVGEDHDFYEDQVQALATAEADFQKLHKDGKDLPVPTPPDDFEKGLDGEDDELESIGEEEPPDSEPDTTRKRKSSGARRKSAATAVAAPRETKPTQKESRSAKRRSAPASHPARPSKKVKTDGKKRKREEHDVMDDVDEEPPVSRKRKTSRISRRDEDEDESDDRIKDLQEKLDDATQTIATLKRRLRKRENQIAELADRSTPVRVITPAAPENLTVPARVTSKVRSKNVTSEEFAKMFKDLQACFTEFKTLVFAADDSRSALERETKAVQEKFEEIISNVKSCEEKAAEKEKVMCAKLTDVLEADISIEALRAHKAGNYIKSMGKACKAMPLINHLCAQIRNTWMTQVKQFMKEQQSASQEGGANAEQENQASRESGGTVTDTAAAADGGKTAAGLSTRGGADGEKKEEEKVATQEAPKVAMKEPRHSAGNSEATGKPGTGNNRAKEADKAETKLEVKAETGKKEEGRIRRDFAASGSKDEGKDKEEDSKDDGEKADTARVDKDAMDVDSAPIVADKKTAPDTSAYPKGGGPGRKPPQTQEDTDTKPSTKTSSTPTVSQKDAADGNTAATVADKGDNEWEAGSSGKTIRGSKASTKARDAAPTHGTVDGMDKDREPQASPKRQSTATAVANKSQANDTPRSVTMPPKVEQAQKDRSDLPPSDEAQRGGKGGKSPAVQGGESSAVRVQMESVGEVERKEDERPKSEDTKPSAAAVGKEAAAS